MVRHITLQWSDRDKALIDGIVIGAGCGVVVEVFLADPEIRLPARIDMFTDHWTSILDSLSRDTNAFNLFSRNIDIQQATFRESFRQYLPHSDHGELRSFAKVESFSRNQTESQSGNAKNSGFQGAGHGAGIGSVVTEISTMIYSRSTNIR